MAITQNGNSFTWTGTITVTNATDITTGVATIVLSPNGGVGTLPFLAQGVSGLPPVLRNVTVNQYAYGVTPPAPTFTPVSIGGAGQQSVYDLTFGVNAGPPGSPGVTTISGASDLTGTPTDKYILVYNSTSGTWVVSQQKVGGFYNPSSFTTYTGNGSNVVLAQMAIPAQNWAWRPRVHGWATVTGTPNTKVNLICTLGSSTGDQVALSPGVTGTTGQFTWLMPGFGSPLGATTYGSVAAGQVGNIYLVAQQTASTTDNYSISASSLSWTVEVAPIP